MRHIILKLTLGLVCLTLAIIGITLRIGMTMEEQIVSVVSRYDDGFWRLRKFAVDRLLIVQRFPELRFVQFPYLSPDARYVAWTVGNDIINMMDVLTGEHCHLTTGTFLSWSPNGRYFAFRDDDAFYVYDVVEQGCSGQSVLISPDLSVDFGFGGVVWSPDSEYVLFEALVSDAFVEVDDYDIYSNSVNGDELTNLTADSLADENYPQWSRDGQQILYLRFDGDDADIYVMDSDGANPRRITENTLSNLTSALYWSPNEEMIAFTINGGLHVLMIEAGLLIGPIDQNWSPEEIVWLDDNQRILFRSGRTSDLYIVNRDGRFLHRLTYDDNSNYLVP